MHTVLAFSPFLHRADREMLSFLSEYSNQTTCACLPERNFFFLPLATLFNWIYKRICFTSLVPEMYFLAEILENPKTASAVEALSETMSGTFFFFSITKSHGVIWAVDDCVMISQ